ncbi:MAG: hypothetical protein FD137_2259 [Spirochaetes bacterium]|nr:MAG: hypothetical protein FD137_2259 [Spirochaetota bacterium]
MEERYPKRLFAALELEDSIRLSLGGYARELKLSFAPWRPRWVDPSLYHLTLHFYGECGEARARLLREGLGSCPRLTVAPRLEFTGLGFLPSKKSPRVLYLGVSIHPEAAFDPIIRTALSLDLDAAPRSNRPWKAHLTLARLNSSQPFPLREKALLPPPLRLFSFPKSFALLESTLLPQGPEYRALERYPLL